MDSKDEISNGRVTFHKVEQIWWVCNECELEFSDGEEDAERRYHDCTSLEHKAKEAQDRLNFLYNQDWKYRQIEPWWRIVILSTGVGFLVVGVVVSIVLQFDASDGEIDEDSITELSNILLMTAWPFFSLIIAWMMLQDNKVARKNIADGSLRRKSGRWSGNLEPTEIEFLVNRGKVKI